MMLVAPLILLSMETLNRAPTASPILWTSVIISRTKAADPESFPIWSRVAPVRADTGLKEQFPQSLIQISSRIFVFCGAFRPPEIIKAERCFTRSEGSEEGSPRVKRSPSK